MKRRTEAAGKLRRTIKRNNGLNGNGSTAFFFYLKIILIWASVIFCDYMSELRVEYLWPFWLLLRSVYDSYKYKGLAFSFLFICICITSDLICLFLIPVQWIFFVASTYVMIQFVWIHTDKIGLPTIILWLIFVWMEAKIRWKDSRNMPHLDLCRPFAAHCIGYPVVTLGFGFKSYIGYRIRQRKQKEVAKENEFYMQLLQQALPQEEADKTDEQTESTETNISTSANNNIAVCNKNSQNHHHHNHQNSSSSKVNANGSIDGLSSSHINGGVNNSTTTNSKQHNVRKNAEKENGCIQHLDNNHHNHHQDIIPNNAILSKSNSKAANHLNFNNLQSVKNTNTTSYQQIQNGITKELNVPAKCSPYKNNKDDHNTYIATNNKKEYEKEKIIKDTNYDETITPSNNEPTSQKRKDKQQKDNQHQQYQPNASNNHNNSSSNNNCNNQLNNEKNKVCDHCQRLENEAKRLKSELQTMKSLEQEVRQKYENVKGCLQTKQKEHEELQKQYLDVQAQERRNRQHFEAQLNQEKRLRKQAEEKANMLRCPDTCKMKKMHLENENNKLRRDIMLIDEAKNNYEKQNRMYEQELRKYEVEFRNRDQNQNVALQNALAIMQEKNATLEKNLSAETRIKLDLFSALGEARRQIEIKENCLRTKDKQLEELEAKTVQILAIMPSLSDTHFQMNSLAMTASPNMEQSDNFAKNSQLNAG